MNLLQSFNLSQHVNFPTHKDGNVLDLVITRADEVLICDLGWFHPVLSDHQSVHYRLCSTKKTVFPRRKVFYRNLASIDMEIFCQDLANCDLFSRELNDDLSSLICKYYFSLKSVIDCHAHEKEQVRTLRPIASWFSVDLSTEKKKRRHLKQKWRTTRSDNDRKQYVTQCKVVKEMIVHAKEKYYAALINENKGNQHVLFRTVNKFLHR